MRGLSRDFFFFETEGPFFLKDLSRIKGTNYHTLLCTFNCFCGLCVEQLDNIEEGLDTLHADMKEAESALTDLNKCCGLFTLPWDKSVSSLRSIDCIFLC